jgi:hypothetical protein
VPKRRPLKRTIQRWADEMAADRPPSANPKIVSCQTVEEMNIPENKCDAKEATESETGSGNGGAEGA